VFDLPVLAATGFPEPSGPSQRSGLHRYARWIPVPERFISQMTMGEGATPMLSVGESVHLKLEYVSPTLSFKDRGAVVLIASALERGVSKLVADSSGNAGSAMAAYASRARLECLVFVPAGISPRKQAQIRAYGARLEEVAGDRTATTEAAIAAVNATGAMYASHIYDPLFLQGTKTFAYEVFEQLGHIPDAIVVPVGNGTLLLGAARGFRELEAAGMSNGVPALIGVQAERCAPLATAWEKGSSAPCSVRAEPTLAEGIAIPSPARGAQILAAVADTGGCVVSVPESAIRPAQHELAGRGLLVEPTAAIAWAAKLLALGDPFIEHRRPGGDPWERACELAAGNLVVPLCGSGLKAL
jgi:threonine synthase